MVPGYDQRQARTGLAGLTKPDPKDQAAQIVAWAICWPWNLVWTICVYNPFRYVAEFVLKEIQSALFEISNGQFSSIEQDLTLDPPPPPYPVPAPQPRYTETTTAVAIEVTNEAAHLAHKESPAIADNDPVEQPAANSTSVPTASIEADTADAVEKAQQTNDENDQAAAAASINQPEAADAPIEDSPEEVEAELAEGGSSDSYTWTPPSPTSFVPLSNQPLRAVKYETGSAVPARPEQTTKPPEPANDPWLAKRVPNQ